MSREESPYIVLVEPEASLAHTIRSTLENRGYRVKELTNGQQALRQVSRSRALLMIVDAELPDMSGQEVCRTTQSMNYHIPVILLSTMMEPDQNVTSQHDSPTADKQVAYLKKPIEKQNLLYAVSRQLQDHPDGPDANQSSTVNLGTVQIDLSEQSVFTPAGTRHLTDRETELVRYLYQNANKPVYRKKLLENVWQYQNTTSTRTVDVHIAKLRSKIELDSSEPEYIITIHGIGYMLKTDG